jgi:hypothetical protein
MSQRARETSGERDSRDPSALLVHRMPDHAWPSLKRVNSEAPTIERRELVTVLSSYATFASRGGVALWVLVFLILAGWPLTTSLSADQSSRTRGRVGFHLCSVCAPYQVSCALLRPSLFHSPI